MCTSPKRLVYLLDEPDWAVKRFFAERTVVEIINLEHGGGGCLS